ncbi:MAG: hypothetical protein WA210_18165 [Burkholderiaceae bacterium]
MSAIIVLQQRNAIHMAVDGASYTQDGILRSVVQKCFALPTLPMLVAGMGLAGVTAAAADEIAQRFATFDDAVAGLEAFMPEFVSDHEGHLFSSDSTQNHFTVYFVGLSAKRGLEAYAMFYCDPDHRDYWRSKANGVTSKEPFVLERVAGCTLSPPVTGREMSAAGIPCQGSSEAEILERFTDVDLLHVMEIQRRDKGGPLLPGMDSKFWVGGHCQISTLTGDGTITQRTVHRWPDKIGEPITPETPDWQQWRTRVAASGAREHSPAPLQLTRQQRRALEREQRKSA